MESFRKNSNFVSQSQIFGLTFWPFVRLKCSLVAITHSGKTEKCTDCDGIAAFDAPQTTEREDLER